MSENSRPYEHRFADVEDAVEYIAALRAEIAALKHELSSRDALLDQRDADLKELRTNVLPRLTERNAELYRENEALRIPATLYDRLELALEFIEFICARDCYRCCAGEGILLNSAGFWSHREDGNHCSNHSIYKDFFAWVRALRNVEETVSLK